MMPEWLLSRPVVITLAVIGAALAVLASVLGSSGRLSQERTRLLNRTGYGFMWASIALFIYVGFRSGYR